MLYDVSQQWAQSDGKKYTILELLNDATKYT